MSWYKDPNVEGTIHTNRWSVAVNNQGGAAAPVDATIAIPGTHPIWDVCAEDGADIRAVDPAGNLLDYDLSGFDYDARTVTVRVDGYTAPAGQMFQIFIYAGNPDAEDAQETVTISSAKTGAIEEVSPPRPFVYTGERFGDERPRDKMAKGADETVLVAVDFGAKLLPRPSAFAGHRECEEIAYATVAGGGAVTASVRFVGGSVVLFSVAGGTHGQDYTICVTVVTTEGQTFKKYIWLAVRTVDEA